MASYRVGVSQTLREARDTGTPQHLVEAAATFYTNLYAHPTATVPIYVSVQYHEEPMEGAGMKNWSISGDTNLTLVDVLLNGDAQGPVNEVTDRKATAPDIHTFVAIFSYTGDVSDAAVSDTITITVSAAAR